MYVKATAASLGNWGFTFLWELDRTTFNYFNFLLVLNLSSCCSLFVMDLSICSPLWTLRLWTGRDIPEYVKMAPQIRGRNRMHYMPPRIRCLLSLFWNKICGRYIKFPDLTPDKDLEHGSSSLKFRSRTCQCFFFLLNENLKNVT
jgi:hypothetical protein